MLAYIGAPFCLFIWRGLFRIPAVAKGGLAAYGGILVMIGCASPMTGSLMGIMFGCGAFKEIMPVCSAIEGPTGTIFLGVITLLSVEGPLAVDGVGIVSACS